MKKMFLLLAVFAISHCFSQIPQVASGKIIRIDSFQSKYITARNVDIWLPGDYYTASKKYAVLYMHDGQMLFDSTITWNKQEWMVDETVSLLLNSKIIKDIIVVGVWNGGKTRHIDYFPEKPFQSLSQEEQDSLYNRNRPNGASVFNGKIQSDNYLKFLVQELKPRIDSQFSTLKTKQNTFIAGSSMGGLISVYAICEYPNVFGGAACLSTHWPGIFTLDNNPIPQAFYDYLVIPQKLSNSIGYWIINIKGL